MRHLFDRRVRGLLLGSTLALAACGGDENPPPPSGPEKPELPAPEVAGTPETDALADAPARCGQADHAWLRDLSLGEITTHRATATYPKGLLDALAAEALGNLPVPLKYDVVTHVFTYVTQDRGKTVEASALLAWPTTVPEDAEALPTLMVLHGTSGFTDGCGPSAETETAALAAALASIGYVVVAPDYIGLKNDPPATGFLHPYLVGQATAIASLDAARAVLRLPEEIREGGARPSARLAVVGGSQGGHAALWVDRLAPYYARELDVVGIATTVPPADMLGEGQLALTTQRESTANMIAFYGASSGWYDAEDKLGEVLLPPLDKDVPAALGAGCDPGDLLAGKDMLSALFQPEVLDAAASGALSELAPWGCMAAENGLTTTSVSRIQKDAASYGILFITGEADKLVDTPTERAAFKTLCDAGMPMRYLECAGASHTKATTWALPEILTFVGDRVAGKPFEKACSTGAPVTCAGTPAP
ncbi:lipase family protein [Polyangium sp. 6x1]|uniref:lipase family protein n=1 Tax=Polyangium sp. 6x1 TaxID=3042689 RepID=UPI002482E69A|nr:lipase family protein [Polyangium sp. 6x1]MDI1449045.1 lipase family protein [Polyangium sp. 6x1]